MRDNKWVQLLACVTGLVNQRLLLQNEYLAAENRILRSRLPSRLRLSDPERSTLPQIGKRVGPHEGVAPTEAVDPSQSRRNTWSGRNVEELRGKTARRHNRSGSASLRRGRAASSLWYLALDDGGTGEPVYEDFRSRIARLAAKIGRRRVVATFRPPAVGSFPARWAEETRGTATDVSHLSVNPLTVHYREITGKSSHVVLRVS
jgi:hypothetical protein